MDRIPPMAMAMPEDLVSLVYFSHAKRAYDDEALLALLQLSRSNNAKTVITGMLLYHDGNFVQALEGPRQAVEDLFARIHHDPAHEGIIATRITPIRQRQFAEWSMGFLPGAAVPEATRSLVTEALRAPAKSTALDTIATSMLKAFSAGLPRVR